MGQKIVIIGAGIAGLTAAVAELHRLLAGQVDPSAIHLMTPDLGQGACQAMVDAVTLAGCGQPGRLDAALVNYQRRRWRTPPSRPCPRGPSAAWVNWTSASLVARAML